MNAIISNGTTLFAGTGLGNSYGDLFVSTDDGANWRSIGATIPRHDVVLSLAVRGSEVWAGTGRWLYKTTNSGASWSQIGSTLPGGKVQSLLASDSDLIASVSGQGLYRSTDDGQSWLPMASGLPSNGQFPAIIRNEGLMFAGSNGKGVFRSTDNGINWTACDTGIAAGNDRYVFSLSFFKGSVFAGTLRGIYRSDDSGNHWTSTRNGLPIDESGNAFVSADSTLYVLANGQKVYRTFDLGAHWSSLSDSTIPSSYMALALHHDKLYLGGQIVGVVRTDRANIQWQPVNNGVTSVSVSVARPATFQSGVSPVLLAGTNDADYGYGWHSDDAGQSWNLYSSGSKRGITDMAILNDELFAATSGEGILHSTDHGTTWAPTSFPATATYATSICITPRVLYAGITGTSGTLQSHNSGASWEASTGSTIPSFVSKVFYDNGPVYAVGNVKVFRTLSEGNSWDTLSGDPINSMQWTGFAHTSSRIVIGSSSGLFESTDEATTWKSVNGPLATSRIFAMASDGDLVLAGVESAVLISTDGGGSWSTMADSLPAGIALETVSMDSKNIYVGTIGYGLWSHKRPSVASVSATPTTGSFSARLIADHQLGIQYAPSVSGEARFALSDVLGNRVGTATATAGNPSFHMSLPTGLANGSYFLTMSSNSGYQTIKLQLP